MGGYSSIRRWVEAEKADGFDVRKGRKLARMRQAKKNKSIGYRRGIVESSDAGMAVPMVLEDV